MRLRPRLRPMTFDDRDGVHAVYAAGILGGDATFFTQIPERESWWPDWFAARPPFGRLVAEEDGEILGYAGFSPTSSRPFYAGVLEDTIYVAPQAKGRGLGKALLGAALEEADAAGAWLVTGLIFAENRASIRLHEGLGFRLFGIRERMGYHEHPAYRRWRDVAIMDRRSPRAGLGEEPPRLEGLAKG